MSFSSFTNSFTSSFCNIMAEGFRFMPLGLVRLRTFRLSATWTQVFMRACGADVSFRDVKIKIPDRGMWMTSCTGSARRILGDLKKSVSGVENWTLNEKGRLSGLAEAKRICAQRAPREMGGGRWKSQNRKNVYLSPYVEEPLNSKVIKSFGPELRIHKCFSCFGILMFYVYIYYEDSMYVSRSYIMAM